MYQRLVSHLSAIALLLGLLTAKGPAAAAPLTEPVSGAPDIKVQTVQFYFLSSLLRPSSTKGPGTTAFTPTTRSRATMAGGTIDRARDTRATPRRKPCPALTGKHR